jgi:hypothetical protein
MYDQRVVSIPITTAAVLLFVLDGTSITSNFGIAGIAVRKHHVKFSNSPMSFCTHGFVPQRNHAVNT